MILTHFATITYPQIDPIAIKLGPIAIRWYGLAYLTAFLSGYFWLHKMVRSGRLKISGEHLSELVAWLSVGVVLGGRAGWWLFYHRPMPKPEPWYEPIAIWHGGMSFHGGLIGVLLALAIWARVRKASILNLADCLALVTPVGLFLGRIANFINAELVGRSSNVPWAMIFPEDTVPRHPSQLYEAFLEGPLLLAILWGINKAFRPRQGQTAAIFLICYGIFRFLVEFTREPDVQIGFIAFGWLTMGQLLSAIITVAGAVIWVSTHNLASESNEQSHEGTKERR